jgi:hypothetical protein
MGNNNSTNSLTNSSSTNTGTFDIYNNFDSKKLKITRPQIPASKLMLQINQFLIYLFKNKAEKMFNKNEKCKDVHIVIEDKILNALSKGELLGLKSSDINLLIGYEYNNPEKREEVCKHFKNYYKKKIDILSSISTIADVLNTKEYYLKNKEYCLYEKPVETKKSFFGKKTEEKVVITPEIRNINRKQVSNTELFDTVNWKTAKNRNMFNIPQDYPSIDKNTLRKLYFKDNPKLDSATDKYYIMELDNPTDCVNNNGKWVDKKYMQENGYIPVENLVDYKGNIVNQNWFNLYNIILESIKITSNKLENIFYKICFIEESLVNSTENLTFKEVDITDSDLDIISNDVLMIITNDIINIEKYYLELIFTDIKTKDDLDKIASIDKELKEKEKELTSTNMYASPIPNYNQSQMPNYMQTNMYASPLPNYQQPNVYGSPLPNIYNLPKPPGLSNFQQPPMYNMNQIPNNMYNKINYPVAPVAQNSLIQPTQPQIQSSTKKNNEEIIDF